MKNKDGTNNWRLERLLQDINEPTTYDKARMIDSKKPKVDFKNRIE